MQNNFYLPLIMSDFMLGMQHSNTPAWYSKQKQEQSDNLLNEISVTNSKQHRDGKQNLIHPCGLKPEKQQPVFLAVVTESKLETKDTPLENR